MEGQQDYRNRSAYTQNYLQVCTSELALLFCLLMARPYLRTRPSIHINPIIMSVRKFEYVHMRNHTLSVPIVIFCTKTLTYLPRLLII